ncbi:hypothetical protein GCM10027289_11020 [Tsukamurella serpentis]
MAYHADTEMHARARRVAERDRLFATMLCVAGAHRTPAGPDDEAPITEPIAVIGRTEQPASWLSAG